MFYDQLKRIQQGSKILELWGLSAPLSLGGMWIKMGDINLKTPLYTSSFGDTRLFFKHRRLFHDRSWWPSTWRAAANDFTVDTTDPTLVWGNSVPAGIWPTQDDTAAKTFYVDQVTKYGCPFGWLIGKL